MRQKQLCSSEKKVVALTVLFAVIYFAKKMYPLCLLRELCTTLANSPNLT